MVGEGVGGGRGSVSSEAIVVCGWGGVGVVVFEVVGDGGGDGRKRYGVVDSCRNGLHIGRDALKRLELCIRDREHPARVSIGNIL